jgi:hypothetical protein
MALELLITFRDPTRQSVFRPFCLQVVLRRAWWPLAKRFGLPMLQQLECLHIKTRAEVETLIRELDIARKALARPEEVAVSDSDAAYMLKRSGDVQTALRAALEEWENVDVASL